MGFITPTLPSSGQDRGTEEIDALNTLQAILAAINGNLDGSNLAAAVFAPYRRPHTMVGALTSADGTGVRVFDVTGASYASGAAMSGRPSGLIVPTPSPWTLTGKTPKMRVVATLATNNVAPGAGNCLVALRAVTLSGTGGSFIITTGSIIGSVSVTPVQAGVASGASADFDVPAAGFYVLTAAMSSALAANVAVMLNAAVELHHV